MAQFFHLVLVIIVAGILGWIVQQIPVLQPWAKNIVYALIVLAVVVYAFSIIFGVRL